MSRILRTIVPRGIQNGARDHGDETDLRSILDAVNKMDGRIKSDFTTFKNQNDKRLDTLEEQQLDLHSKFAAFRVNGFGEGIDLTPAQARHDRTAFASDIRTGRIMAGTTGSTENNPAGGYLVPRVVDLEIHEVARNYGVIRGLATTRLITGPSYPKNVRVSGATAEWVAETQTRSQTDAGSYAQIDIPAHELSAMPRLTQKLT
jgi:HK97 family phage major capsid protein